MDEATLGGARAAVHIWTLRWTDRARRLLRTDADRLGLDLRGARVRPEVAEGRLLGTAPGLTFWYYPRSEDSGALYLVQHCPICRRPFPTHVATEADLAAWLVAPVPACHPEPRSRQALRHWWHKQISARPETPAPRR